MKNNNLKSKSFIFAVSIVNLYKYLSKEKMEFVLSKQILRSGTSIGANVREAQNSESKLYLIHKLGIAQKETDETMYWLELLKETEYLDDTKFQSFYSEANELLRIIRSIILTTKQNLKNKT
jgi:four helix bundle protein